MIKKTSGEYLGYADLDIIDDIIADDDLVEHRDEILQRMQQAVEAINSAAVRIMQDLYYEASAPYADRQIPKSFQLRTSDYHQHLSDALLGLKKNGFFVEVE